MTNAVTETTKKFGEQLNWQEHTIQTEGSIINKILTLWLEGVTTSSWLPIECKVSPQLFTIADENLSRSTLTHPVFSLTSTPTTRSAPSLT